MVLQDKSTAGRKAFLGSLDQIDSRAAALAVGGIAALGVAGAVAFSALYNSQAPLIDALGKLSESTDIGVIKIQAMQDASERAGIPMEALNSSLQEGLKRISEAAGGAGEAGKILAQLGLSAEELRNQKPADQITQILTALEGVENVNDRIKFADKIFGGQGVDLIRLTTGAINEAEQQMRDLDIALTEVNVANVEALNDQLQKIGRYTSQSSKIFIAEMAPAISAVLSETLALQSGMLGVRSTSQLMASSLIPVIGLLGDTLNGLDNSFDYVRLQLAKANAYANEITYNNNPNAETAEILRKSREEARALDDQLAGQTGAKAYSDRLRENYERQTAAADAAEKAIRDEREAAEQRKVTRAGGEVGSETGGDDIDARIRREAKQEAAQVEREIAAAQRQDDSAIARIQREAEYSHERALTEEQLLLEQQERTASILDGIAARDISRTDEVNAARQAANQQYHDEYLQLVKKRAEEQDKRERDTMRKGRDYIEQGIAHFAQKSEVADALHKALTARRMFREGREAVMGAFNWGTNHGGLGLGYALATIAGGFTAALIAETVGGGSAAPAIPAGSSSAGTRSFSDSASSAAQTAAAPQQTIYYTAYFQATPEADRESVARKQLQDDIDSKKIVIGDNLDVVINVLDYE